MRGAGDRPALGPGLGQDHVDDAFVFLVAVVEQRQAPITVAETPEHGRHAVDGALQLARDLDAGRPQASADIHQMTQDGELKRGVALGMAAVGENLAVDLPVQQPQAGLEAVFETGQADAAVHQPLDGEKQAPIAACRGGHPSQVTCLAGRRSQDLPMKVRAPGALQEISVNEPVGEAFSEGVGAPGAGRPAPMGLQPGLGQGVRPSCRLRRSQDGEVAEPGEAVQRTGHRLAHGGVPPWVVAEAHPPPTMDERAVDQCLSGADVAGPGIGRRAAHGARRFADKGKTVKRRAVEQVTKRPPAARWRQTRTEVEAPCQLVHRRPRP